MILIVPSRRRHEGMLTLRRSIPESWRDRTIILVHATEAAAYRDAWPQFAVETHTCHTISAIRQHAVESARARNEDRLVMLDDDLQFYVRRQYDPPRLRDATPQDLDQLWAATGALLGPDLPLIGVSFRQHNDSTRAPYTFNGRIDRAYAVYLPVLTEVDFQFGAVDFMENFDLALTLLLAGFPNLIWWHWANDQKTSDAPGGCSEYRTAELHVAAAQALARRHAPFVALTTKTTKTAWLNFKGKREDVICAWAQAYVAGRRRRGRVPPHVDVWPWLPEEARVHDDQSTLF